MSFTLYNLENTQGIAHEELEKSQKNFGWIPNLHAVMAEAPNVLIAYKSLHQLFQGTSFNAEELTVIWQTINHENQCHYCVPAHTAIAHMMKVDENIINALNNNTALPTEKLETLKQTTRLLLVNRGHLTENEVKTFKAVGYGNQQLLEILLGIAQKTISNYVNHLADTPLDDNFAVYASS